MEAATEIAVIIPARDAQATLPKVLEALAAQRFPGRFEVIVVDDGSRDGTAEVAASSRVVGRVLRLGGVGPGRARNAGVAVATAPCLAFLDADCEPAPAWLGAGVAALASAELVLGETRPPPDQPIGPFDRTLSVVGDSPLFEAANMFVRRELFERLAGFESWLGPKGGKELGEDVWLGWRARRAGARISACPEALVYHAVEPRAALAFAAERLRLRYFPALVKRIPELRRDLLYGRLFLNERAACFDAALLSLLCARALRRPLVGAGALPYLRVLARDIREPRGVEKLFARAAADSIGFAAMVVGSLRYRALLL
jgi:glycosyltransferase involved in cell wall biosynthesis